MNRTPMEVLLDTVDFHCCCCGAPSRATKGETLSQCACHLPHIDTCDSGKCADHCKCIHCRINRRAGLVRINWTGRHHLYLNGQDRTMCNIKLPDLGAAWVNKHPAISMRETDCNRCKAALWVLACNLAPIAGQHTEDTGGAK